MFLIWLFTALFLKADATEFPVSDHCDGERFHNSGPTQKLSFSQKLKYQTYMTPAWDDVDFEVRPAKLDDPPKDKMSYTKVGQSTVLIQVSGLNILTDPIWSGRAGMNTFPGPLRSRPPALRFEDLPKIDVVLISHNHSEHLDLPTLQLLDRKFAPLFIVGLGTKKILGENGIANVTELDWWQKHTFQDAEFHFVPARHSSGQSLHDREKSLWGGFYLRLDKRTVFFAGDTGYGAHFREINVRLGAPEISFLPIGGYSPRWSQKDANMSPEEAVEAHLDLSSKNSEAIHYETFKTSHEEFSEPVNLLRETVIKRNVPRFRATKFGENVTLLR